MAPFVSAVLYWPDGNELQEGIFLTLKVQTNINNSFGETRFYLIMIINQYPTKRICFSRRK